MALQLPVCLSQPLDPTRILSYVTLDDVLQAAAVNQVWLSAAATAELWAGVKLGVPSRGDMDIRQVPQATLTALATRWQRHLEISAGACVFPPASQRPTVHLQRRRLACTTLDLLQMNPDALPKKERGLPAAERDAIVGLKIWISCPLMCAYFARHDNWANGRKVCCLGDGVGMLGVFLASQQPSYLFVSDGSPLCVLVARANLAINSSGKAAAQLQCNVTHQGPTRVEVAVLSFGRQNAQDMLQARGMKSSAFDVIVASDVVYGRTASCIDRLFETVDVLLSHLPTACFFHGYTDRRPELTARLLKSSAAHGFNCCEVLPLAENVGSFEGTLLPGEQRALREKPA